MKSKNDVVGIILPFDPEHVSRILRDRRSVIAKFISRVPRRPDSFRLKRGMKVVFYISASQRKLGGEGTIKELGFLPPHELTTKYHSQLYLSESELSRYVLSQPNRSASKPMLVLKLTRVRAYPESVVYHKTISMVGEYLTQQSYDSIRLQLPTKHDSGTRARIPNGFPSLSGRGERKNPNW